MRAAFEVALRQAENAGCPLKGVVGIVYRKLRGVTRKRRR